MDAGVQGFHHVVSGGHCVKDGAENGEGGSFAAGHFSDVGGRGNGEILRGEPNELAGAVQPPIDETRMLFCVGGGRGGRVVPSKGGREDGFTRLGHAGS